MSLIIRVHGELYHYGVKGMKWGVRRTAEQLGHKKVLKKASKHDIQRANLLNELKARNEKFTPSAIHGITRTKAGDITWLETGNDRAGLTHILKRHSKDFVKSGISKSEIPKYLMKALSDGNPVKRQGRSRMIYEVMYKGTVRHVAIELGPNGFIIGANPSHHPK